MTIAARYEQVRERIVRAAQRAGRSPSDVSLIAVSKSFSVDVVMQAVDAGITELGENRAQELREKAALIEDRARWHFIGHLQSNKVRHVVGVAALVHSVDSVSLAEAIARRARSSDMAQPVLIEVNVAGEARKHGVAPSEAEALARNVAALEGIELRGLMTMPPWPDDPEESRPHFRSLAELRIEIARVVPEATELSMGMTRDFEVAVEEGATLVRVGEAIFGPRSP
ncbi:MAG: YggS family pyridoxal phosphate-dependent enzyme [Actinomycetota bacterium]